jgi:hypothetical protein
VAGVGVVGAGVAGAGLPNVGTGVAGTGVAGTGVAGTGVAGTGVAGAGVAHVVENARPVVFVCVIISNVLEQLSGAPAVHVTVTPAVVLSNEVSVPAFASVRRAGKVN